MAMQPTSEDPFEGPLREEQMAQIYALLGDADEAIPILKRWVQVPSATSITPALLRIDPIWDPIRSDPRFQEMVAEKKAMNTLVTNDSQTPLRGDPRFEKNCRVSRAERWKILNEAEISVCPSSQLIQHRSKLGQLVKI